MPPRGRSSLQGSVLPSLENQLDPQTPSGPGVLRHGPSRVSSLSISTEALPPRLFRSGGRASCSLPHSPAHLASALGSSPHTSPATQHRGRRAGGSGQGQEGGGPGLTGAGNCPLRAARQGPGSGGREGSPVPAGLLARGGAQATPRTADSLTLTCGRSVRGPCSARRERKSRPHTHPGEQSISGASGAPVPPPLPQGRRAQPGLRLG